MTHEHRFDPDKASLLLDPSRNENYRQIKY